MFPLCKASIAISQRLRELCCCQVTITITGIIPLQNIYVIISRTMVCADIRVAPVWGWNGSSGSGCSVPAAPLGRGFNYVSVKFNREDRSGFGS